MRLSPWFFSVALAFVANAATANERKDWPEFGGDAGGSRFSPLDQVNRDNVGALEVAWTYRTGDVSDGEGEIPSTTAFQATPILVEGTLYVPTPFNRVIALDPQTGEEIFSFDPEIDLSGRYANQLIARGVAYWHDASDPPPSVCRNRIFGATNDARLFAIDAQSGKACVDFGDGGFVDLNPGAGEQLWKGEYQVTSAPLVANEWVIVGSAVSDNARTDAPSGVVRAYDARGGELHWAWDVTPRDIGPEFERSKAGYVLGSPNVWGPMSYDAERDLLFVPTGNPAPDYYRGGREAIDTFGSSVVALAASTGEVVWSFQTVHHDLWDYDVAAQPTLTTIRTGEGDVPVVIQATKMGHLFILHRETGKPIFGVEERPVPQDGAPAQKLSPTQPFPVKPPPLSRMELEPDDAWGLTNWDRLKCKEKFDALRFEGIYTPPSLEGTLMFPGNIGGSNWGGVAVDPERQIVIANVSNLAFAVTLIARDDFEAARSASPEAEHAPQRGTPYGMRREPLISPFGIPCNPPPWGTLAAVDLSNGELMWQVPFGTVRDITPVPLSIEWGTPSFAGPLVTAAGLVFIGAAMDDYMRVFDVETGTKLWETRLPAGGQATPMSYLGEDGKQYIVIAAGGHARAGTTLGDYVLAYRLP